MRPQVRDQIVALEEAFVAAFPGVAVQRLAAAKGAGGAKGFGGGKGFGAARR